ncbi:hypothetical protein AB0O76_29450 [Streptomyces sp. NPDC086554]|uniref:hypothetical protein n=1 Tax=Streptomyces sp. NPDC086554 TaxID=3154864 RepID=UPI003436E687
MAPELDLLRNRLVQVDHPDYAITWLRKKNVRATITALVCEHPDVTHAALDAMPRSKTLDHFRSVLVSVGALEFRDEGLLRLEDEVRDKFDAFGPGEHQRALRGFIYWHLLRRLRGRLNNKPASHQQLRNVRAHANAADAFLRWLESQGKTLSTCTQTDVETYARTKSSYLQQCSAFIRWAVHRRYTAPDLVARAIRWTGPAGPHNGDERWTVARRLLHDDSLSAADRVAGLLVLLYAQTTSSILRLTCDRVRQDEEHVLLYLGERPIQLPEPLDALMLELVATRASNTLIRHEGELAVPRPCSGSADPRVAAAAAPGQSRCQGAAGPQHGPVHTRVPGARRAPSENARRARIRRRRLAAGKRRRLDELRRRHGRPLQDLGPGREMSPNSS